MSADDEPAAAASAQPPARRSTGADTGPAALDPETDARAALVAHYLNAEPERDPYVLPLIAALSEVIAVAESVRDGREPPQPHDRRSLMADAQRSLTALGDELTRSLRPASHDYFHGELASLPALLDDRGGVLRLLNATKVLADLLRRPMSSQAVWRDPVAAVAAGTDPEVCARHAHQLRELEQALGHEWLWRGRKLRETARTGAFADCEELLSDPPPRTAQTAWFVFANADVEDGYLRVGQVQFFSHRLWPEAVTNRQFMERLPDGEFPEELDDHALELLRPESDADAHVYARVELVGDRAAVVVASGPGVAGRDQQIAAARAAAPRHILEGHPEWAADKTTAAAPPLDRPQPYEDTGWRRIDAEFTDAWGFSLDELARGLAALTRAAADAPGETASASRREAAATVAAQTGIPTRRARPLVDWLVLGRHPGYDMFAADDKPWRANRERSLLRRPLVELPDGRLCWSEPAPLRTLQHVLGLCSTGRLNGPPPVARAVKQVAQQLDRDFEQDLADACRQSGLAVAPTGLKRIGGRKLERRPGQPIGDIDVLAWHPESGCVWLLEAKRLTPSYEPSSLPYEIEKLERAADRHRERLAWVRDNAEALNRQIGAPPSGGWKLQAAVVTDVPLAGAYAFTPPLPIWTIDTLPDHLADPETAAHA